MIDFYINQFTKNASVFKVIFSEVKEEEQKWRENNGKWNLLEVVCHLYDEEREDFRSRVRSLIDNPGNPFEPIDPAAWVIERNYADRDFTIMVEKFLQERDLSVNYLKSLKEIPWQNSYDHPKLGPVSAGFIMANWLAHDYLHLRQIIRIKYRYLLEVSHHQLHYAGDW